MKSKSKDQDALKSAAQSFQKAASQLMGIPNLIKAEFSDDVRKKFNQLLVKYRLNEQVCHVKLENNKKALECGYQILSIEPENFKCLFNMGTSSCALGLFDEARKYYSQCLKLQPANPDI